VHTAYSGYSYLSAAEAAQFTSFFRKARRWGVVSTLDLDFDVHRTRVESQLFAQIITLSTVNIAYYQVKDRKCFSLRKQGHCYEPFWQKLIFSKKFYLYTIVFKTCN
jgi:hypothetical protein